MCTISRRAITRARAMIRVRAFKRKIIVRNFAIAAVIAGIGFVDAVARPNAIRSSARAIWLYVNVIQTYAPHAVLINSMWPKSPVKMSVFSVACTSIC